MQLTAELFPDDLSEEAQYEILYQTAIAQPLEVKIKNAIMLIQTYENSALQKHPDGYHVAFSGGKDSVVLAKLFEMSGVKFKLHYNNTTIDPPELIYFMKEHYPQVTWHSQPHHLTSIMLKKGKIPPTRMRRWCCEIYKERGGRGTITSTGVRAAESKRRKGLWRELTVEKESKDYILCPILYWTDGDVWTFIKGNNLPYCSLYSEGFRRLGCVGCPVGGDRRIEFKRWPGYERLWKNGITRAWEKWKDIPNSRTGDPRWWARWKTAEDVWSWWMEEKNVNDTDDADCQGMLW